MNIKWNEREQMGGCYTDTVDGVFLSYQPNYMGRMFSDSRLDSANPETAIVLVNDKPNGDNRYLLFRGDRRDELASLFPYREKLIAFWKEHGGHFWSDTLEDASTV